LIGSQCLGLLLEAEWVKSVLVISRRDPGIKHRKLKLLLVDFDDLSTHSRHIKGDVLISAFGTTIKNAGNDKALFRKWDIGYPLDVARYAHQNGCTQFLFVSSVGPSEKSLNFYLRVKAEMEHEAGLIGFSRLDIFQPSMLLGDRKEHRTAEKIITKLVRNLRLPGPLKKYNPIESSDVARALVHYAQKSESGKFLHLYSQMIHPD